MTARHGPERSPRWQGVRRRIAGLAATPRRVFVLTFALVFLNIAAWSFATPMFASPDEPSQLTRAVALDHGQLIGGTIKNTGNAFTSITVPALYAGGNAYPGCFRFNDQAPASCSGPLPILTLPQRTTTYAGRYPPLYYGLVGLPSLVTTSVAGVYEMRLMSALLSSVLIALAMVSIVRWSAKRLLLIGVLVALTPMVFFLSSTVNASGFEICAAICLWTSGLVLVLEHSKDPPHGLVAIVGVSTGALLLARAVSPLWAVLIFALLALMGGWRNVAALVRARRVQVTLGLLVLCGVVALLWIGGAHALDLVPAPKLPGASSPQLVFIVGETGTWIEQMVGVFGWLDTSAPLATYLVWFMVIGFLLLLAASEGHRREIVALGLLVGLVLAVPIAISYDQAHRLGSIWQGRYTMPLAVGIPLIAAAIADSSLQSRLVGRRASLWACLALGFGSFLAFVQTLRRYTVGLKGSNLNLFAGSWQPPLGTVAVTVAGFVLTGIFVLFVRALVVREAVDLGLDGAGPIDLLAASTSSTPSALQPDAPRGAEPLP